MSTQLLIYETAVPVSSGRHGKGSVEAGANYGFARGVNSIPLMAVEFLRAATEYAVVFTAFGDDVMPAVVLGVKGYQVWAGDLRRTGAAEWPLRALFIAGGMVLAAPGGGLMPLSNAQMAMLAAAILVPAMAAAWLLGRRVRAA